MGSVLDRYKHIPPPEQPLQLVPRTPIGTQTMTGLACGRTQSRVVQTVENVYDETYGAPLRELRVGYGITLGEAAAVLGLRLSVVSDLEFGRSIPATDEERGRTRGLLMRYAKEANYVWRPRTAGAPEPTA